MRLIPGPDTPTVNFAWLKELLLCKDLARNSELDWVKSGLRFLDGSVDLAGNRIGFVSYPRTGNTMTRGYLEAITGIHTGSNMSLILTSNFQISGMGGEDHTCADNDIWVTKTHWPYDLPDETEFVADRALVITRNPIDVMASQFYMNQLGGHSMTSVEKVNEVFPAEWDAWIRGKIPVFKAYHERVIELLAAQVPVYFLRYEDQTSIARQTTTEFFKFILDSPEIDGTVLQHRIDEVTKESHEKRTTVYKLKSS